MSGFFANKRDDLESSSSPQRHQGVQQEQLQLPFTNDNVVSDDFASNTGSTRSQDRIHTRSGRSHSSISAAHLSSSYGQKTPARSFYHQAIHASLGMIAYVDLYLRRGLS